MSHQSLRAGREFDLIRRFWRTLGDRAAASGDDCAFLEIDGTTLALTSDLSVEGTHFRLGWIQAHEIGWRACVSSLSDLAAVAAEPLGVLVSLGVPGDFPESLAADVMDGIGDAAAAVGCPVLGGDVVASPTLTIDVAAVGRGSDLVRRHGGAPGDGLYVTGTLGGPAAALAAWGRGEEPDRSARERFAHPEPRIGAAKWLATHGAKAMIDVSDGVLADAGHLAAASGVRCVLERERVPVHAAATPDEALVSGEEYELLVALPATAGSGSLVREFEQSVGIALTRVGTMEAGEGVVLLEQGEPVELPPGFEHFD